MAKINNGEGAPVNGTNEPKTLEPPHNLHLARKKNVVKCRIDLYKVPPKCVNFDPTRTHLYVDTLKFTKKYLLKVPYPEGVEVDPTDVEAVFDSGVITCELPIVNDPHKPADWDEMVKAREEAVTLIKQGLPVPKKIKAKAKMQEPKQRDEEVPELVGTPQAKDSAKSGKTAKPASAQKPKKASADAKSPAKSKSGEKPSKKRPIDDDDDVDIEGEEKKKKKPKKSESEQKEPKKKNFLDDASAVLQVADEVNDIQEKQIQERLDKEYAKLSFEMRKKIETREKKKRIKEIREIEASKPKEPQRRKEKPKKKKSATKVSFNV
jgi:hypothetical protein